MEPVTIKAAVNTHKDGQIVCVLMGRITLTESHQFRGVLIQDTPGTAYCGHAPAILRQLVYATATQVLPLLLAEHKLQSQPNGTELVAGTMNAAKLTVLQAAT